MISNNRKKKRIHIYIIQIYLHIDNYPKTSLTLTMKKKKNIYVIVRKKKLVKRDYNHVIWRHILKQNKNIMITIK